LRAGEAVESVKRIISLSTATGPPVPPEYEGPLRRDFCCLLDRQETIGHQDLMHPTLHTASFTAAGWLFE